MNTKNWFQSNVELAGKYSFKNMQKMTGMEGLAWSGSLYFNGKKVGLVRDDGNGGMLWIEVVKEFQSQLKADATAYYIAKNPEEKIDKETFQYMSPEEFFLPFLADWQDTLSKLKSTCKTKVISIDSADKAEGTYLQYKPGSVAVIEKIKAKYPEHFYINDQF